MALNKIAIIGAGPAGLVLARILYKNRIAVVVYEGETSASTRTQGGSLDLQPHSGQAALKEAGLFSEFEKCARYESQNFILKDRHGKIHVQVLDTDTGKPEIDRRQLRQILLDSLPEDMIRWDHHIERVEVGAIHFSNQPSATGFALIVGADGAWSRVRPHLTTIRPFYAGISGIELIHADLETKHPQIAQMVGTGSHFVFGEETRRALLSQRQGDGSLHTYAFLHQPEDYLSSSAIDLANPDSVRELLLREYADFAPEFQCLLRDIDLDAGDEINARALYMLPVGLQWPTVAGLTCIGDAAHVMTPFAGEGVNMAMLDALDLARAIIENPDDLARAVSVYETGMFPRQEKAALRTWRSLMARFQAGGIKGFKERMRKRVRAAAADEEGGAKVGSIRIAED